MFKPHTCKLLNSVFFKCNINTGLIFEISTFKGSIFHAPSMKITEVILCILALNLIRSRLYFKQIVYNILNPKWNLVAHFLDLSIFSIFLLSSLSLLKVIVKRIIIMIIPIQNKICFPRMIEIIKPTIPIKIQLPVIKLNFSNFNIVVFSSFLFSSAFILISSYSRWFYIFRIHFCSPLIY